MNTISIAIKNLLNKPLNLLLSLILFSLGVGLISFLMLFSKQLNDKFEANLANIDLVIGAKGSPLQLILCNMYHIDNPTGNIDMKDAKMLLNPKHPLIAKAIPLSLGDNYQSFRIVGTNHEFLDIYKVGINTGQLWKKDLEVTIGAQVANKTGLKIGDKFTSSHGFDHDEDLAHDHAKFIVSGILKPSGSVADQLILTNTASIWKMHAHENKEDSEVIKKVEHDHKEGEHIHKEGEHDHDKANEIKENKTHFAENSNEDLLTHQDQQITAILIKYKNKKSYPALNMPRAINENTSMQAASPAYEINKLYSMIGTGTNTIKAIAFLISFVSMISIFISLYKSMKERKYELALMRVMGSSRSNLFGLILIEGIMIALLGWLIGIILSHVGIGILGKYISEDFRYSFDASKMISEEWWLLLISILLGISAALIPAIGAANTDINKTLGKQ
jgi:putative ABC transport system permease protein